MIITHYFDHLKGECYHNFRKIISAYNLDLNNIGCAFVGELFLTNDYILYPAHVFSVFHFLIYSCQSQTRRYSIENVSLNSLFWCPFSNIDNNAWIYFIKNRFEIWQHECYMILLFQHSFDSLSDRLLD